MRDIDLDGLLDRDNPALNLYRNTSFRAKMAVGILLVLVVASVVGALTVTQTTQAVEERQIDQYEHSVQLENNRIDDWRQTHRRIAGMVATSPSVADADTESADAYIESQMDRQTLPSDVVAVHIVDTGGESATIVASSVNETEGMNESAVGATWPDDPFPYRQVTDVLISDVYEPSYTDEPVIAFVGNVSGHEDRVAVVVTSLDAASSGLDAPVGGTTTVVNEEGTIVLSTNQNLIGEDAYSTGYMTEELWQGARSELSKMQETTATGRTTIDGEKQVSAVMHSEETNWVVATHTPVSLAYEISSVVRSNVILLVVMTTLAAALGVASVGVPTIRDLRRLTDRADEVSQGDHDVDLDTDRDDEIGEMYRSVDRMQNTLQSRIDEVEQINDRIATAVDRYSTVMKACSEGDLSHRVDTDTGVEPLDQLGENFNEMMADIEEAVGTTQEFGDSVGAASEEVTRNIQQVEDTSNTVAEAAQKISDNASEQNEMLDDAVSEMNALSSTIEEVAASADEVATQAQQTAEVTSEGREAAEEAVDSLDKIEEQTDTVTDAVTELHSEVEEIEEITDYIQQIAKQTNMLAINAGIEAARAGEAGEGFGVVADEVKQLADDASDAAEDISESLETIQERADMTRDEIEEMQESVDEGTDTIGEALDSMTEISESVDETVTGIQQIDDATERQAESAQEVVEKMDRAASISDDTVSAAEDVAAATEEQSASVQQISDSITHLAEQAAELRDRLSEFDTEAGGADDAE